MLAVMLAVACTQRYAAPESPGRERVHQVAVVAQDAAELIKQLGDETYAIREAAMKKLVELPSDADEKLLDALRKTTDAEVRWRLQSALRERKARFRRERLGKTLPDIFSKKYSRLLDQATSEQPEAQLALVKDLGQATPQQREISDMTGDEKRTLLAAIFDNSEGDVRRLAFQALFPDDAQISLAFADRILQALDETDPDLCLHALKRFRGPEAEGKRAPILPWLFSPNAALRAAAVRSLVEKAFVKNVSALLKDEHESVRAEAMRALREMDAKETAAEILEMKDAAALEVIKTWPVPALIPIVARKEQALEIFIAWKLPESAKAVAAMLADENVRHHAAELLIDLGIAEDLIEYYAWFDESTQAEILRVLREKKSKASLAAHRDDIRVAETMLELGETEPLAKFIDDADPDRRRIAVHGVKDGAKLLERLKDEDGAVRRAAFEQITKLRIKIDAAELLKDARASVRLDALKLGADADSALQDPDPEVRALAARTASVDKLVPLLQDEACRTIAAERLAKTHRTDVEKLLDDKDAEVRAIAVRALADKRGVRDEAWNVRAAAAAVIRDEDDLVMLLEDSSPIVRHAAAESLVAMGKRAPLMKHARKDPKILWLMNGARLADARKSKPGGITGRELTWDKPADFTIDPLISRNTVEELLEALGSANGNGFAFVLEENSIRVLRVGDAIDYWKGRP